MIMPAAASISAGLGLHALMEVLPQGNSVPVRLLVDFVVYAAMYGMAWIAVPGGRRSLVQITRLAREAITSRPAV
jgi:hypothetical protein